MLRYLASKASDLLCNKQYYVPFIFILLIAELPLGFFIIKNINYTEIDWIAYMQEVEYYLNGTLDYDQIKGQTGPCVYPAGFLYAYSVLYRLTDGGSNVRLAQYIFLFFYLINLLLVFNVYRISKQIPPYVLAFICVISYRIHSIFILRLFNDPLAMIPVFACINLLLLGRFSLASFLFSFGLSIKMNVLLFAPGLFLVLLYHRGILQTCGHLFECVIIQLLVGLPFLFHNPGAYMSRAFDFGRQFLYQWTVNWRLIPESLFLDRRFHLALLGLHLIFLSVALLRFVRSRGGFVEFLQLYNPRRNPTDDPSSVVYPMFLSNFIGVMFSRSLHYQFYVWYFHTLAYLFWCLPQLPGVFKLLLMGLIELCWNTYPSTVWSSSLLHICHLILLAGLLFSPCPRSSKPVEGKVTIQKRRAMKPKQA